VGAFDRYQRLVGLAYRGELREGGLNLGGFGTQTVYVVPVARGLDLEPRMLELLCQASTVNAGVAR